MKHLSWNISSSTGSENDDRESNSEAQIDNAEQDTDDDIDNEDENGEEDHLLSQDPTRNPITLPDPRDFIEYFYPKRRTKVTAVVVKMHKRMEERWPGWRNIQQQSGQITVLSIMTFPRDFFCNIYQNPKNWDQI